MLSKSAKYVIKAVLYLAVNATDKNKVMVKDIAEPINVPPAYIAKLLQELSKQGIISSSRGPKGGFYLNDENRNHSIMNILEVIDGKYRLTSCLLSLEKCNEQLPCPLHDIAVSSRTKLVQNLKNKSVADLAIEIQEGRSFLPI